MKKQLIEKITRELLAEARRYVAKVLTAEPDVRTTAKANGADLAFKIEFKVRPGFSQLPTDDDILDEVGNAIKNTPQVGITSKYSNGNYYYILSPDQSDKKRMFLYNVYIFRKNKVWENYPDWIDRTSDSTSTDNTTTSTDNVVVGKKNKPKNLPDITVKSSMGSMYRIGQSILLNADIWKSSSKNNIKTYKPLPAVEFINKVVNVTVDMPKLDEPTKTASDASSSVETPITLTDPKVIDAVKNVTTTTTVNTPKDATTTTTVKTPKNATTTTQPNLRSKDSEKQQIKLKNQNIIKNETAELINLAGKLIPNGNKIKPGTIVNIVKNSGDYVQIEFPPKPLTTLPENSIVRVKPAIANLKKIKMWHGAKPIIKQLDQLITKDNPNPNGYRLIDKLPDPIKFIRIENKKALIISDGIQLWVLADILESSKSPVWILKKDIK
jgi:hypothetical protein